MLAARILTAVVLLPAIVAAIALLPKALLAPLVAAVVGVGGFEWGRLCRYRVTGAALYGVVLAVATYTFIVTLGPLAQLAVYGLAAGFWLIAVPAWLMGAVARIPAAFVACIGAIVLVPAGAALVALSPVEALLVMGLIWIADTGAYAAGRTWGRRPLAPSISPGKTWEGVAGGLAAVLAYAIICAWVVPTLERVSSAQAWTLYVVAVLALGTVSVIGDLFESALKRRAAVKDSGAILPGHGGVLDRIDSATAALPVAALFMKGAVLA